MDSVLSVIKFILDEHSLLIQLDNELSSLLNVLTEDVKQIEVADDKGDFDRLFSILIKIKQLILEFKSYNCISRCFHSGRIRSNIQGLKFELEHAKQSYHIFKKDPNRILKLNLIKADIQKIKSIIEDSNIYNGVKDVILTIVDEDTKQPICFELKSSNWKSLRVLPSLELKDKVSQLIKYNQEVTEGLTKQLYYTNYNINDMVEEKSNFKMDISKILDQDNLNIIRFLCDTEFNMVFENVTTGKVQVQPRRYILSNAQPDFNGVYKRLHSMDEPTCFKYQFESLIHRVNDYYSYKLKLNKLIIDIVTNIQNL